MSHVRVATRHLTRVLLAGWLVGSPHLLHAQDPANLFSVVGGFVKGFTAGSGYVAPLGFVSSDVLEESGEVQEIGVYFRNPSLDLTIGFDMLTGLAAKEESLDLRGSITALPSITAHHVLPLPARLPRSWAVVGVTLGLSQLRDMRAVIPQDAAANRSIQVGGNGYHLGVNVGLSRTIGNGIGVYVNNSFRYIRFPSLDWQEGTTSLVPPVGWPLSMDLWSGTVRIGLTVAANSEAK
jgi:hypothetical protein